MESRLSARTIRAIIASVALILVVSSISLYATRSLLEDIHWVEHTHEVLRKLEQLNGSMQDAVSSRRAYAISDEEANRTASHQAMATSRSHLEDLERLVGDNEAQLERCIALRKSVDARLAQLDRALAYDSGTQLDDDRAEQTRLTEEGRQLAEEVQKLTQEMRLTEMELLSVRRERALRISLITQGVALFGGLASVLILLVMARALHKQAEVRFRAEREAHKSAERVAEYVRELEARNRDIGMLSEFGNVLQACRNADELLDVLRQRMETTFPSMSGALCVIKASRDSVTTNATWGPRPPANAEFSPDDCWGLRRGLPHLAKLRERGLVCKHVDPEGLAESYCVPLVAQGETLGLFTVTSSAAGAPSETEQRLVQALGEGLAMALANVQLRERLSRQAITDALTGLHNRRYMEEVLAKEISRAVRGQSTVGIILLDVDHFKRYNDTYGHQAGDHVLALMGSFLKANVRGGDTACRYGGEEFALVMPGSTIENVVKRAESIRDKIKYIDVTFQGQRLPTVTISAGVAMHPDHADSIEPLLAAADSALYAAKKAGRDRVVVAGSDVANANDAELDTPSDNASVPST